ncbi:DUF3617 domain-containing protein [Methylobacterium trifolii]|uniref:DUF3617 family protein n=1 Tax=Methylobacterium trifolii TaxID=1003092 RepID=A0ABQ4U394_9HYPH|nr:DUF3617 family protein [Methylobacterium trifolii]GJE61317.1 hypothetical protein MPOCJGCO_3439 [Methylobacterium trifolii]
MPDRTFLRGACCLALLLGPPAAAAGQFPEAGAYAVEMCLDLPHLQDMTRTRLVHVCLAPDRGADEPGFAVLSENNPLARCPASNLRRMGDELTFEIRCAGRNAAWATARYVLGPDRFEGRIAMQMGGKNMTMTEVQAGRRTGACTAPAP